MMMDKIIEKGKSKFSVCTCSRIFYKALSIIIAVLCFCMIGNCVSRNASANIVADDSVIYYDGIPFSIDYGERQMVFIRSMNHDLKLKIEYSLPDKRGLITTSDNEGSRQNFAIAVNRLDDQKNEVDVKVYDKDHQLVKVYTNVSQLQAAKYSGQLAKAYVTVNGDRVDLAVSVLFSMQGKIIRR
jgi:hypothetical protein